MIEQLDAIMTRVVADLRPLPDVDGTAKARLLIAVAAEREREREAEARRTRRWRGVRLIARGGALAAAAAIGAFWLRDVRQESNEREAVPAAAVPAAVLSASSPNTQLATREANREAAAIKIPVQLLFRAPDAARVQVAGDFNGWDASKSTMSRDASSGLWSITLALPPGRHVYAFVINDSVWMRDPRAQAAPDTDFGRPGSVLLVGRP